MKAHRPRILSPSLNF